MKKKTCNSHCNKANNCTIDSVISYSDLFKYFTSIIPSVLYLFSEPSSLQFHIYSPLNSYHVVRFSLDIKNLQIYSYFRDRLADKYQFQTSWLKIS